MIVHFSLNGNTARTDVEATARLIDVLRDEFGLSHAKSGCYSGSCGSCLVLVDGQLVHGCLVPMFNLRGRSVMTVEGITSTLAYRQIMRGFDEREYRPCRNCYQAKVLSIYYLIEHFESPTREEIDGIMLSQRCRCTDYGAFLDMLDRIILDRRRRKHAGLR